MSKLPCFKKNPIAWGWRNGKKTQWKKVSFPGERE